MPEQHYSIQNAAGDKIRVILKRDKRLKKSWSWASQPDGSVLLRVPARLPRPALNGLLTQLSGMLEQQESLAARRTDEDLQTRAEQINRKYFDGQLHWQAIRWVDNMQQRLGSCTRGGTTDGHIRISSRMRSWPDWVVDYVIAHELLHRRHPNHSPAFREELKQAYPLTERAQGFIEGIGFAQGQPLEEDEE
jgi:hypothetical protein